VRHTLLNDGWQVRPKVHRFAELVGQVAEWEPVTLPHDAMIGSERSPSAAPANAYFPAGVWEYQRTLAVPAEHEGRYVALHFEGVYRDAIVTVNGEVAAHWPYGYTERTVPIDHLLRFGADNTINVEARAHDDSRWYSGAGIHRNVWLVQAGRVHLVPDELHVRTPEVDDGGASIAVACVVRNQSSTRSEATLRVEVADPSGTVVTTADTPVTTFPGEEVTARQRLFVGAPQRWGLDHPHLYTCRASLLAGDDVVDEEATTFGIRTLSLDPARGLRINGEPVHLRGACVHHDNGPIGAATIDRAEARRVELLQAAGFNALRSAHNPMSRAMLDACDRLGVLVMDETFDMHLGPKSAHDHALRFESSWRADTEAMVRKDRNHPSVVLYSIGNEIPDAGTGTGLHAGRAIAEAVRELDGDRFVTQAVTGLLIGGPEVFAALRDTAAAGTDAETGVNSAMTNVFEMLNLAMQSDVVTRKSTEAFSYLDAAGYNYMDTRFEMDGDLFPNRVIVATETHPAAIDVGWAGVVERSYVIGDFTWTGWDYLGEVGIGRITFGDGGPGAPGDFTAPYPWVAAWCGDIDITGARRPQSFYREIVFGLRTDPYIAVQRPQHHGKAVNHSTPWSWSDTVGSWSWAGHEGAPVTVEVYADADEVELVRNGESLGRQPAGRKQRYRAEFETTCEPGELVAVAWKGGEEIGRHTLRSAEGPVRLTARADRSEIAAGETDLAFVELVLGDASGVVATTEERTVTVAVEGPGILQGLASANPCTEEPFTDAEHTTFDGRALAVVRPTGPGTITVTAKADGLDPATVTITAH
jgi:beta-galactosidase